MVLKKYTSRKKAPGAPRQKIHRLSINIQLKIDYSKIHLSRKNVTLNKIKYTSRAKMHLSHISKI